MKRALLPAQPDAMKDGINTTIPLLDVVDIQDTGIFADALLTQRKIAQHLLRQRGAKYGLYTITSLSALGEICERILP